MNIEHRIMNSVNLKKRLSKVNQPFEILRFACLKIDKESRQQYWMFDVGRSIFDVLLSLDHVFSVIHCSDQAELHTSTAAGLTPETSRPYNMWFDNRP